MRRLFSLLLIVAFAVGDVVRIVSPNPIAWGIWTIISVNKDGTYDLYDFKYPATIRQVPEKFLKHL